MKRFALVITVIALLAGIAAIPASVSAASFDDTQPCPAEGPLLVCPTMDVGHPVSLQLRALLACDLYWWEIPNGSVPAGLTVWSSGLITGTPLASGQTMPWSTGTDPLPST